MMDVIFLPRPLSNAVALHILGIVHKVKPYFGFRLGPEKTFSLSHHKLFVWLARCIIVLAIRMKNISTERLIIIFIKFLL